MGLMPAPLTDASVRARFTALELEIVRLRHAIAEFAEGLSTEDRVRLATILSGTRVAPCAAAPPERIGVVAALRGVWATLETRGPV